MGNLSFDSNDFDYFSQEQRDEIRMESSQNGVSNLNGDEAPNGFSIRRRLNAGEEGFALRSAFTEEVRDQYSEILS